MAKIDRAIGKGKVQTLAADNTNRLITEGVLRELLIDLWDSGALQIDEETFLNLQDLADRDYRVGECMVYDNGQGFKIFRATTAGGGIPFVAANWEILTSSGGTANTIYSADGVISGARKISLPDAPIGVFWNGGAENDTSVFEIGQNNINLGGQARVFTNITGGLKLNPDIPQNTSPDPVRILAYDPANFVTKYINSNEIAGSNIYTADGELSGVRSLTGNQGRGLFQSFFDTDIATFNNAVQIISDASNYRVQLLSGDGTGAPTGSVELGLDSSGLNFFNSFGTGIGYNDNGSYANVDWNDSAFANYLPCIQQIKDNTVSSEQCLLTFDFSTNTGSNSENKVVYFKEGSFLQTICTDGDIIQGTATRGALNTLAEDFAVFQLVDIDSVGNFINEHGLSIVESGSGEIQIYFESGTGKAAKYNEASDYANVDWNDPAFANHIPSIQQVKDNVGGGLVDIVSGSSNVAIAETGTAGVKSIEVFQTTAGLLANVYFTGQEITTTEGNFYETLIGERGNFASQTQTVVLASNQTEAFAQDFLGEVQPEEGAVVSGVYAAFPIMQVSSNQNNQRFKIEAYICDGEGVPTGVGDGPVGTLGVNTILIADSGIIDLQANNPTNVNCQGDVENSIPILAGERFRYVVIAERVGSGSANKTVTFFAGSDYNSYFQIPNPSLSPAASKSIDRLEWYVEGAISSTTPVNEFVARRNSAFSTLRGRYFAGNTLSQVIGIKATTGNLAAGGAIGGSAFKVQIRYDDEGSPTQHVYGGGTLLTEQDVFVSPDVGIGTLNSVSNEISFEGIPLVPDKVYFVEISEAGSFVINDLSIEVLTETKTSPSTFLF